MHVTSFCVTCVDCAMSRAATSRKFCRASFVTEMTSNWFYAKRHVLKYSVVHSYGINFRSLLWILLFLCQNLWNTFPCVAMEETQFGHSSSGAIFYWIKLVRGPTSDSTWLFCGGKAIKSASQPQIEETKSSTSRLSLCHWPCDSKSSGPSHSSLSYCRPANGRRRGARSPL
jgi:hypothetical protein